MVQHRKKEEQKKERNDFKAQQEKKPLYGLIGMKMVAVSQWLWGERG